jgi:ABC-2 type transport system ATP-binding protein
MSLSHVIQTRGLTKRYPGGKTPALDHLDLSVNRGEIFGYLGPNGAGKTTTIRLLLDFIRPSSGSAAIFGLDANRDSRTLRRRIGYLPSELALWPQYTGREIVNYLAKLYGAVDARTVTQLADRLELDLTRQVRSYSTGNRRKIGLVLALMHRPELLILDEPTNGLDPLMQQVFNEMMREIRAEGRTVFLSSHMLSEVQAICDRVGILKDGRLRKVETVTDLTRVNFRWVTAEFRGPAAPHLVAQVAGVSDVSGDGTSLKFRLNGEITPLLKVLYDGQAVDLRIQEPTLEEIFLSFYGNNNGAKEVIK